MLEGEQQIHLIVIRVSEGWISVFYKMPEVSWLTGKFGGFSRETVLHGNVESLEGNSWLRTTMRIRTVLLQIFSGWPDTNSDAGVACLNVNDTNSFNWHLYLKLDKRSFLWSTCRGISVNAFSLFRPAYYAINPNVNTAWSCGHANSRLC
jgi:hypothetical protein